jgi:hypothetical protein
MATSYPRSKDQGSDIRSHVIEANMNRARDLRSHFMRDCVRRLGTFCVKAFCVVRSLAILRPVSQKRYTRNDTVPF